MTIRGTSTIIDELGFVPLSKTGAELLFEVFSQRYERGSNLVTSNLPFDEWTEVFGSSTPSSTFKPPSTASSRKPMRTRDPSSGPRTLTRSSPLSDVGTKC